MFDRTGGSNIFGGETAGVVRTSTGGSRSSPFRIFSQEKRRKFPLQESRRSRSTLTYLLCWLRAGKNNGYPV
ncbi:hypothetical protein Q8A73_000652 [Channa argus]|nr:hypothetical protein Q8A73_000652 [Channa argus]